MKATLLTPVLAILLGLAAFAARADDAPGRFTLTPAGEFFWRLDTVTGAVSVCSRKGDGFICQSVADDDSALQLEIDRLSQENEALRAQLAAKESGPQPPVAKDTEPSADPTLEAPKLDFDELAELAAKALRRFQDMVRELKQEETGKEL